MDLKERRELYNELRENHKYSNFLAKFSSWRQYALSKAKPITWVIDKMDERYGKPVLRESNPKKLVKTKVKGTLEVLISYPIEIGGFVTSLITKDVVYVAGAGLLGTYLNWKGEIEMMRSDERIKELNLDSDKIVDELFSRKKD